MSALLGRIAIILSLFSLVGASPAPQSVPATFTYELKTGTGAGGGLNVSMAFTVQSAASDGSRDASVVITAPETPGLNNRQLEATISPTGAISLGNEGALLQGMIDPLNTFAVGCGTMPNYNLGTTWHAFWSAGKTYVIYTVTGSRQNAGHDVAVITMNALSGAGPSLTGRGTYDPVTHLVLSLHSEVKASAQGGISEILDADIANAP